MNLMQPQVTRETILARLEGVHNLYRDGVCAEYLWGYCATGNIVTPFDRHKFGIVLPEWDRSQRAFRARFPLGIDRNKALIECVMMLEKWLKSVSPDVATRLPDYLEDVKSFSTEFAESVR